MQNNELNQHEYAAPALKETVETIQPTPDNPPWNSWAALGVWFASFVFIAVVPLFFLLPYLAKSNINFADKDALTKFALDDPTAVLLQIVAIIPAHILTILLAWLVVTRLRKYPFRKTLGWETGGFAWWYYPLILAVIFVISAVALYFFPEQETDLTRILRSSRAAVFVVAFLATFTAPVTEEVVYRGILYSAFQRSFGVAPAVFIVTLVFAGVHFYQYWGSPSTIFVICFMSLALTLVRVRSKNLLPCIILHTLINGLQSLVAVAQTLAPPAPANDGAPNAATTVIHFFNSLVG